MIEARREAETLRIKTGAEEEARRLKLNAEKERVRITAEAERDRMNLQLEAKILEAQAVTDHPVLLRLKQLDALKDMARTGGKFVIGLQDAEFEKAIGSDAQ